MERAILDCDHGIQEASVHLSQDRLGLVATVAPVRGSDEALLTTLRQRLPAYMVPTSLQRLETLPKSRSDKIDHNAVQIISRQLPETLAGPLRDSIPETNDTALDRERRTLRITSIWQEVLGLKNPPLTNVNFFDIGGHSLLVTRLQERLRHEFPDEPWLTVDLFHQSTIERQSAMCTIESPNSIIAKSDLPAIVSKLVANAPTIATPNASKSSKSVAVVGMSGRFPGASNVDDFYERLLQGYSGITEKTQQARPDLYDGNIWVPKAGFLDRAENFDAQFWNISEEDATDMDPQQRVFLEVAYEALKDAGVETVGCKTGNIGLFVGAANHSYHLYTESVSSDSFARANRGFTAPSLSARTAYHLNISGPNVTVQTNCASSTVALSLAVDAIASGRCDTAVVGGVSIQLYK